MKNRIIAFWAGMAALIAATTMTAPAANATSYTWGTYGSPPPYSSLAAAWWQWALQTPVPINPVLDTTGANCGVNQTSWAFFLAGTFNGGTVNRTCNVPFGKPLFFPTGNSFYGAFTNDPPAMRTIDYVRSQVACAAGATSTLTIDGIPSNYAIVHEKSDIFSVQLPTDNVFGVTSDQVPGLLLTPSADEGNYVLLSVLPFGRHIVKFTNTAGTSCTANLSATYTLNIG